MSIEKMFIKSDIYVLFLLCFFMLHSCYKNSHKKEILNLEVRNMDKSVRCAYCDKYIEGSIESHLRPHTKKIITKFFDT
jgi:hypothetical protein